MMARLEAELSALAGRPVSYEETIPAGRYASPTEVANLVAYLALDAPVYLTGAALVIDGALRA